MFVAIDPGNTGALAFLGTREFKLCALYDMPTYPEPSSGRMRYCIDGAMLAHYFSEHRPTCALVERVASRPGQGVAGVYAFGRGVGVIEGVLQALDIPIHYVAPQTWKRHHNLLKQPKTEKTTSCQKLGIKAKLVEKAVKNGWSYLPKSVPCIPKDFTKLIIMIPAKKLKN